MLSRTLLIGIAIVAAIIIVITIVGAYYYFGRGIYSDEGITAAIRLAYAERGQNPNDLEVEKIVEVKSEGEDGRSIYDVRIKFIGGELAGTVHHFRYYFLAMKQGEEKQLTVENVTTAPADSFARTD